MDHAPNNELPSSETTADNGDEPSAAHFREAARLAAARVRAAMAGMPDETEKTDDATPVSAPSAKAMEAVARKRARSLAGRGEEESPTSEVKSGKKSINKRISAANDKAAALLHPNAVALMKHRTITVTAATAVTLAMILVPHSRTL